MRNGRGAYLGQARRFLTLAEQEFVKARPIHDDAGIRQAAEKAWGAIVQATNALLVTRGLRPAAGTGRKHDLLVSLEARDPAIRESGVADRYGSALQILHARCFYDGDYNVATIERGLHKVAEYITTVSRL